MTASYGYKLLRGYLHCKLFKMYFQKTSKSESKFLQRILLQFLRRYVCILSSNLFGRGRTRGRKPVLVIITDGISQDNVLVPANSLKQKGVEIFSLGIGKKFRRLQLQQMASSPSHVFTAGFRRLSSVLAAIKNKACLPFVPRKFSSHVLANHVSHRVR